ncbi:MAG: PQQ-binding-like beta-propeller repeat protein [Planctomycetota bacterium]|nr:PQQ-binding-like beta-propeller repeat protein [Planctomycetota bacterium]
MDFLRFMLSSMLDRAGTMVVPWLMIVGFGDSGVSGADWPSWRGLTRNGYTLESSGWVSDAWFRKEPAWTAQVSEGCTSPVIAKGRLYTLGWENENDTVVCLDAHTGELLWSQSYTCPRYGRYHVGDEIAYSGPTATPEFDPATGLLYTLSADGDLNCWNAPNDGGRVWGINLYDAYHVEQRPDVGGLNGLRDYGYITAPLVHGDWLIVAVGAREGHLMAFDKRTGERRWVSESVEPAGHCGGLAPIEVEGIPCLASLTLRGLLVLRLDEGRQGKTIAHYDWLTHFANNVVTPAVHKNSVLLTSGYNRSVICRVDISLKGATKVWEVPYMSGACTPVVHDERVYWVWETMHCLDFATGEQVWEGGSHGSPGSCIVTADGKLIVWGDRGKLVLVEPGEEYHELSRRVRIFQAYCWPHVALADERLYCKDRDGNLNCYRLKPIP